MKSLITLISCNIYIVQIAMSTMLTGYERCRYDIVNISCSHCSHCVADDVNKILHRCEQYLHDIQNCHLDKIVCALNDSSMFCCCIVVAQCFGGLENAFYKNPE